MTSAHAQQQSGSDAAELATKLNNPIASLISVPFQSNFDHGMGPVEDGFRYTLNFQPVLPFRLTGTWNMISRTITPFISENDVVGTTSRTGLGDITQSFFLSPAATEPFIWGAGPSLLVPTATDDHLGSGKFGIGPTFVVLKQHSAWTYGALEEFSGAWMVARVGAPQTFDVLLRTWHSTAKTRTHFTPGTTADSTRP